MVRARKPDAPYEYVADLVELARQSDYLMVACKGGPETRHLVSAAVIDALGPKGTLINVARGSVVDEAALIAALAEGRLGHAALDVFESEPNPSPELLTLPNVIVQPHHGSATVETRTAIGQLMIDNLGAHFAGQAAAHAGALIVFPTRNSVVRRPAAGSALATVDRCGKLQARIGEVAVIIRRQNGEHRDCS